MRGRALGEIFSDLNASPAGLTSAAAAIELVSHGPNRLNEDTGNHPLAVLLRQFPSPLVLVLLAAAALSFVLGETVEASIDVGIVLASTGLGFYQSIERAMPLPNCSAAYSGVEQEVAIFCSPIR